MAFCTSCGTQLAEGSAFCHVCGQTQNGQYTGVPVPTSNKAHAIVVMIAGFLGIGFSFCGLMVPLMSLMMDGFLGGHAGSLFDGFFATAGLMYGIPAVICGVVAHILGKKTTDRTQGRLGKMFGIPSIICGAVAVLIAIISMVS